MRRGGRATEHKFDVRHREFGPGLNECVQTSGHDGARPVAEQVGADHACRHPVEPHIAVE